MALISASDELNVMSAIEAFGLMGVLTTLGLSTRFLTGAGMATGGGREEASCSALVLSFDDFDLDLVDDFSRRAADC